MGLDEKKITKKYTNNEITVVWKPDQCIHSTICWKNLISVFNPKNRPWVDMSGADSETIMNQVKQCPSGALSYYKNDEEASDTEVEAERLIEVMKNGPLLVYGNITVKSKDGEEKKENRMTAFCRCGASSNKPYCDGSHQKIGFEG
ncbi:MAG: (4Fe-4S)-binding protein [bacterium]|nr:(4Fe-4S)-binding protein [bacterium]